MRICRIATTLALIAAACVNTQPLTAQSVKVVTVTVDSPTVTLGHRTTARVRVRLANGTYSSTKSVVWGTSKPGVALVSTAGVVSTIATGSTAIAAIVNGVKGEATLTVVPSSPTPPPPPAPLPVVNVSVALGASSLIVGQTTQAIATPHDSAGDAVANQTITWNSLNPSVASVSATGLVTALAVGSTMIRGSVGTVVGSGTSSIFATAPVSVIAAPTPPVVDTGATVVVDTASFAELPRVFLNTAVSNTPSTGRTITPHTAAALQAALDTSRAGDRIKLDSAGRYVGNFWLSTKAAGNGEWITVQSAGACPSEGTRVSPRIADSLGFPRLISATQNRTLVTIGAVAKWRFTCLTFTNDSSLTVVPGTITVGSAGIDQNTLAKAPSDIIFDRLYVYAPPLTDDRACFQTNSARTAIIDSYVAGCKSTFDAVAFVVTNGPGPFKLVNNYLESSGENVAMGGADPGIPNLVPADFEIRRNHIAKNTAWKGTQWVEKNLIESKNSTRVLVDGNVLENTWVNGQPGYTLALWSANQQGTCNWCVTSHWTFSNNMIRNVSAGINLTSGIGLYGGSFVAMHHMTFRNNLWINVTNEYGKLFQLDTIPYLTIEHNTAFSPNDAIFVLGNKGTPAAQIIRNNLFGSGIGYGIVAWWGSGAAGWDQVKGGAGTVWAANVLQGVANWYSLIPRTFYPSTVADIGFAGGVTAPFSATATPDSLALTPISPYHNAATDGTDIGADIAAIKAAIAGVSPLGARRPIPIRKP